MTRFAGFSPALFDFFAGLRADNSREYWTAHRSEWEHDVRDPMRALADELGAEFGAMRMLRPNRDLRFSADKTPYRLHVAAMAESHAAGGFGTYVEASDLGMAAGYGASAFSRDQLERYRAAVGGDAAGGALERARDDLIACGLTVGPGIAAPLARVPRGFPADHPRADLLRAKGVVAFIEWPRAEWMLTREVFDRVRDVWHAASELAVWLETHVGARED